MVEYVSYLAGTEKQELFSSTDTVTKDKVISVRLEEALYSLLQAQAETWNLKTVSETVRKILSFHFLPLIYEIEWMNRIPEYEQYKQEQETTGISFELSKYNQFLYEVNEYYEFTLEAISRGKIAVEFMEEIKEKMETVLNESKTRLENVLEQKQAIK